MNTPTIVAKFGGSSLANAERIKRVADIIRANPHRNRIIVSAPGKRHDSDTKVTDLLIEWHTRITGGKTNAGEVCDTLFARFSQIACDLHLVIQIEREIEHIKIDLEKGASLDYAKSRGEYLIARMIAEYLGFQFVDAAHAIFFDVNGRLDTEKTNVVCTQLPDCFVIPGFYGQGKGQIVTFDRGGSDITGALVAAAVRAKGFTDVTYENWTDVSGIRMADPRIVNNPRRIDDITYAELRELTYSGASVFHSSAMFPVEDAGIPTHIRNTNDPKDPGTLIIPGKSDTIPQPITGIAGRTGFTEIRIYKRGVNDKVGFIRLLTTVLERFNVSIEHMPSGIDRISVIVNTEALRGNVQNIDGQIKAVCDPDRVEFCHHVALIAVVGRGMIHHKGSASKVFALIEKAGVNVRMITQGGDEMTIIIATDENDMPTTINAIYNGFVA